MNKRLNDAEKGKIVDHIYSIKCSAHFRVDSYLESQYAKTLEFSDDVVRYNSQPFTTKYIDFDGKTRRYTPDFAVEKKNGDILIIEVKRSKIAAGAAFKFKFGILKKHIKELYGIQLTLISEADIPEKLIKNTEFLYPYRRKKLTNQEASVAEVFSNTEITFLALKNHIVAEGMNINSAYKLLAFKMFSFNLMAKINDDLVLGGVA